MEVHKRPEIATVSCLCWILLHTYLLIKETDTKQKENIFKHKSPLNKDKWIFKQKIQITRYFLFFDIAQWVVIVNNLAKFAFLSVTLIILEYAYSGGSLPAKSVRSNSESQATFISLLFD